MPDDIFDIVDEFDNVVSNAPRSYVHANRLIHRAAHIIIFSKDEGSKKILLQKRSMLKDTFAGAYTTSCSGHVDSGEDYDIAVVREMFEETGYKVDIAQLNKIGKLSPCRQTGNEFTFVYTLECPIDTIFNPPADEVASLDWVDIDDFEKMIKENPKNFTPSFLYVYDFYCQKKLEF